MTPHTQIIVKLQHPPKLPHTGPHTGKDPPKNPDTTSEYPTQMMVVEKLQNLVRVYMIWYRHYYFWYEGAQYGIGINIFSTVVHNLVQ